MKRKKTEESLKNQILFLPVFLNHRSLITVYFLLSLCPPSAFSENSHIVPAFESSRKPSSWLAPAMMKFRRREDSVTDKFPDGNFPLPRLTVSAFRLRRKLPHRSGFRIPTQAKQLACSLPCKLFWTGEDSNLRSPTDDRFTVCWF